VSAFLLDVSVLIALVREDHTAHRVTKRWFKHLDGRDWATCPLTQAGFIRIISNPKFLERPPDVNEAIDMLQALASLPGHQFWTMEVGFAEATKSIREKLFGHQQVTDAYLLGLAIRKKGKLATLDHAIPALAGDELNQYLEIVDR
jgi:toxin-antitoxin system PIN domain toxin